MNKKRLVVFYFLITLVSSMLAGGTTDTSRVQSANTPKQPSLIQSMTKEQLNLLVEFLLELDTIPPDLHTEIQMAYGRFNTEKVDAKTNSLFFPAADIYLSWEINNLFPEKDMLKLKGDTSISLQLKGSHTSDYFHPFDGPITSKFGWRDSAQHNGIDIDLNRGDKVSAAFNGMVRVAKRYGGFGNVVIIRHYNGLETVYAHLWKIKVKPGEVVNAGQLIGLGGSTGHSTGSHLHFEIRLKGVPINPKYIVSLSEKKLLADELMVKKTKWGLAAFPKNCKYHTVEKGDTLFEIAKQYGISTAQIKQLNGFTSSKVRLKAGQVVSVSQ